MGLVGEDRMEALRQRYGSPDYRAAQGVMRQVLVRVLAGRFDDDVAALDCPVDLVWGSDDTAASAEMATRAKALIRHSTLQVLPDVGHLVPTEAPDALCRVILQGHTTPEGGAS
jgi:pimeloyl-ACP methyl ester carboxylesterase